MQADIESLGYPLVFKAGVKRPVPPGLDVKDNNIAIRSEIRALTGMQKEAVVYFSPTGTMWRMVSDEGPYLNGTDLAPFPLAFFATGMVLSFADELLNHAKAAGVSFKRFQLVQDNFYTMEGSAIRGDMIGGALPVEILVEIESDSSSAKPVDTHTFLLTGEDDRAAQKTLCMSERTCFLHAAMRGTNETKIRVQLNSRILET
jgi:hypothetical protein